MPSVFRRTSSEPVAVFGHSPRCACALRHGMPRIRKMVSASTSSATLRVLENGALYSGSPFCCAAARSTWLVPMQKQPSPTSFSAALNPSAVIWVAERIPMNAAFFAVSIGAERINGALVHAFEQQDMDFIFVERIGFHEANRVPVKTDAARSPEDSGTSRGTG